MGKSEVRGLIGTDPRRLHHSFLLSKAKCKLDGEYIVDLRLEHSAAHHERSSEVEYWEPIRFDTACYYAKSEHWVYPEGPYLWFRIEIEVESSFLRYLARRPRAILTRGAPTALRYVRREIRRIWREWRRGREGTRILLRRFRHKELRRRLDSGGKA